MSFENPAKGDILLQQF